MSLNDIQLNASLLVNLYRHSLVETGQQTIETSETNSEAIHTLIELPPNDTAMVADKLCLGNNKKNTLLIVRYDHITFIPDNHLTFITSILGACKLGIQDVGIFNLGQTPQTNYSFIKKKFGSPKVLLFGVTPTEFEMPLDFPFFQVQPFDHSVFLFAPGLQELEADRVLKSKLWVSLKKIFDV